MRYRIYFERHWRTGYEYRETPEGAVLRANYLIDQGAAGVEIWDSEVPDRVYVPSQFDELLARVRRTGRV